MRRRKKNISFYLGLIIISLVIIFVVMGIFWTPYDPNGMSAALKNSPPSLAHLFGTDNFGRDILSRVMVGAKTTFLVAFFTVLIGASIGTIIGALTGYYGGLFDEVLMRLNDGLASFPSILLALVFVSIIGTGKYNIILALGVLFIPSYARIIRSEFITLKEKDFVKNAELMGANDFRIMFVHILPNTKPIFISSVSIGFNNAVLAESSLSYLNLGVQPPDASLGRMLSEAQPYLFTAPWYVIFPGIMIILMILGFSLLNDSV